MTHNDLTMAEIEKMYPNEWVFVDCTNYKSPPYGGGIVVAHSPDRDEFDHMTSELSPSIKRAACHFTGKPDANEVWLL